MPTSSRMRNAANATFVRSMKLNKYKTARNGIRRIVTRRTVERSKAAVSFNADAISIRDGLQCNRRGGANIKSVGARMQMAARHSPSKTTAVLRADFLLIGR